VLVGPVMTINGLIMGKKRKKLEATLTPSTMTPVPAAGHSEEHAVEASRIADVSSRI
jgi:hypothetical protein